MQPRSEPRVPGRDVGLRGAGRRLPLAPAGSTIAPFAACGVELEYMIVDAASGDVKPIAETLLRHLAGRATVAAAAAAGDPFTGEVRDRGIGWSNELVAHVVEVKNPRPVADFRLLDVRFADAVARMNAVAAEHGARLMPSAMHPWMDPRRETRLWSASGNRVYAAYDRIFDCRRHGWANLQSMHVNLPFDDALSFVRLHDAIRLVLPILPALAASSPFAEGRATGWQDWRLETYRTNAAAFPSITGAVVPEIVDGPDDYATRILQPMFRELSAADPEGVLAHEWLNSRGAIPRFDRSAIEIRVIDMQECPRVDLAIAAATVAAVRALYDGPWGDARARRLDSLRLASLLFACARDGERAILDDPDYLACFGLAGRRCEARELWAHLVQCLALPGPRSGDAAGSASEPADASGRGIAAEWLAPLEYILDTGPLARRMLDAVSPSKARGRLASRSSIEPRSLAAGDPASPARLSALAVALCECLAQGRCFEGID